MVALVSTLHDPDGRMIPATRRLYDQLREVYDSVAIVPTSGTTPDLLRLFRGAVVEPLDESNGSIGVGRRHALRLGLESGAEQLHYCDFDRVLHWLDSYQAELCSAVKEIQRWDYLMLGRTERAFATHPRVQVDTESITNHAFSLWFGTPVDISAGSCGVSRRAAELLLSRSTAPTNATDTEWPALVRVSWPERVGYLATEGLEFETPDYYAQEIAAAGSLEKWLEERSRPLESWIARTRLTLDSLEALRAVTRGESRFPA